LARSRVAVSRPDYPVLVPVSVLALLCAVAACDDSRLRTQIVLQADAASADGARPTDASAASADGAVWPDVPPGEDAPPPPPPVDGPPPFDDAMSGTVCGNGVIDDQETCDDGNARPGDGCSGICRVEPNYTCPAPGAACLSTVVCGDGKVGAGEACDDGNGASNDGCSSDCKVEAGYACAMPGQRCTPTPTARCGDGVVNQGETCDDGGTASGDGCNASCQLEPGWTCPMPNAGCARDEYCGDGRLSGSEQCDDGNNSPGDGCSGACRTEPFFQCPTPGMPCASTIICGDGKLVGDEACDDGNRVAGDGCAADCKRVEAGWTCPGAAGVGGGCTRPAADVCGDGKISYGEFCDDGNPASNDGCSAACQVEPGFTCMTPGMLCARVQSCGDGLLSLATGEQCDDANTAGGDGCSAQCIIEANYVCPTPGQRCQSTVRCSDRKVNGGETCDDGNNASGDGCSATCQLEAGWTCTVGGTCRAICGDGLRVGPEQCDDHNTAAGDGCGPSCRLEEPAVTERDGWQCPTAGQPCTRTTCGNGMLEGSEQCDDGNNDTADGCSPFCRKEPVCPSAGGPCSTACGDGLLLPVDLAAGQECDDGNTVSGDGCSSSCKVEQGYQCTAAAVVQNPLILPVVYRDFRACVGPAITDCEPNGHPDFQRFNGALAGIVQPTLSAAGKPLHIAATTIRTSNNKPEAMGVDYFGMWYRDTPAYNRTIVDVLTFPRLATGEFQFDHSADSNLFFPIDGRGWGNYTGGTDPSGNQRNFHFTSEVRYWFEYRGGEKLDFTGDDDVWVFINRRLAVDLGGVHGAEQGTITLDGSNGSGQACDLVTPCPATRTVQFGLTIGSVYEIVVFQAERHTTRSRYKLTLSNFTGQRSACATVCGDGVVAGQETCDLGPGRNTGAYGTCNPDCTLPPRCGDGMTQSSEQCDDGVNLSVYGGASRACAPGCVVAPFCGDGRVDGANGEACDQGTSNGMGYGFCTSTCQLGPRCGDGAVTNGEECDQGVKNGTSTSACTAACKKKCGNGAVDPGEQCDDGAAANTGAYGKCTASCTFGPRCGDGIKNGGEACDDGKNDGSYGACAPMCQPGPRCGDGTVQTAAGEVCDSGSGNEAMPYGPGKCSTRCRPAPRCGDKAVDSVYGERCDDGVNSGQPGSCKTDCSGPVPLASCGDGTVQPPEQCDRGAANGAAGSACDATCHKACGNGIKDPGEQCDDGKNDGSYGTCRPDCTLASYCGDGVPNGPEQCDRGTANEANPYGAARCTTRCTVAPSCGDGRIQAEFGETCDGTPGCSATCKMNVIQ
jgi:fibro-slime domain-containing protein